jgi:hypothetical protein
MEEGQYYETAAPEMVTVTVSGLPSDRPYDVFVSRIDETHGNAYAVWQGQGRPSMSEMTEVQWQALRDAMDSPAEPWGTALCGDTFSAELSLPSPGVLFVELR